MVGIAFSVKDVILLTEGDPNMFDVRIHMPTDASKEETEALLAELDARIMALDNPDVEATVAVRGMTRTDMGFSSGDHLGMVTVFVVPVTERSSLHAGRDLVAQVSALYDDVVGPARLEIVEVRAGPPRGAPVAVRIRGEDYERLVELAEQVLAEVRLTPGTRNASHDYELGKQELQIKVDEQRAALHGLTPEMVSGWLRSAFGATPASTLREGDDEIDIVVQLREDVQQDPARIASLQLIAPNGDEVAIREIADVSHGRGPGVIRRYQQKRVVSVLSGIDEDATNSGEVNSTLQKKLAPLEAANPDIRFEYGGQFEETQESVDSLFRAFIVAMLLIYTILATQFQSFSQPLVVMAAIPLSFIGVTGGFLLSPNAIGLIALVGVVGLTGIVVNDSLVLVDFINKRRDRGLALDEAIVESGKLRLRPIFLTSITTIAGLVSPVAGDRKPSSPGADGPGNRLRPDLLDAAYAIGGALPVPARRRPRPATLAAIRTADPLGYGPGRRGRRRARRYDRRIADVGPWQAARGAATRRRWPSVSKTKSFGSLAGAAGSAVRSRWRSRTKARRWQSPAGAKSGFKKW